MIGVASTDGASRTVDHGQAVEALACFSLNGTTPFGPFPDDFVRHAAETAHALTIVLSNAIHSSSVEDAESMPSRPRHMVQAVDAIGMLIALSLWASEAGDAA